MYFIRVGVTIFFAFFAFFAAALLTARPALGNSNGPQINKTGAPTPTDFEGNCAECHGPSPDTLPNQFAARLVISPPSRYCPGASQSVAVSMQNPQPASGVNGFEIVAKNTFKTIAGALSTANANSKVITNYGMHTAAGSGVTSWNFSWTAPAAGTGLVTFYGYGNASNGNGINDSDDWMVQTNTPVPENAAPGVPPLLTPVNNAQLTTQSVDLQATEAADANAGETIRQQFQLCNDAACDGSGESTSANIAAVSGTATWSLSNLPDNTQYWWRVRASDGCGAFSAYSAIRSFSIDVATEAPSAPVFTAPAFNSFIASTTPLLTVSNATDADVGDVLTYSFAVATDAAFGSVVTSVSGVPQGAETTSWQVTPALTTAMRYYVRVVATDLAGASGPATTTTFVRNIKPLASNLSLTPATADTTHILVAGYTYSDTDGNAESGTRIRWFQNDLPVAALHDELSVDASMTEVGDVWYFTVTPRDGMQDGDVQNSAPVTILNARPSISAVDLSPSVAYTDTDLTCTPSGWSDADGDAPAYDFVWTESGSPISGATAAMLDDATIARGDAIACEVTPKSMGNFGATLTSATLVVSNRIPVLSAVAISPTPPAVGEALSVTYLFSDLDADGEVTREIRWTRDGLPAAFDDVTQVTAGTTTRGETWAVELRISDGFTFSTLVTSAAVTVNGLPVAGNVAVTPASPDTTDPLAVSYDYTDPDGHPEDQTETRWFKNGAAQHWLDDLSQVPATATTRGDAWWAAIRPHDGIRYGLPISSAAVIVRNLAPTLTSTAILPAPAYTKDILTCTPTGWNDFDGDAENILYAWSLNGAPIGGATGPTLAGTTAFDRDDDIICEATPTDGLAAGEPVTSSTTTILNSPPVLSNLSAGPDPVDTLTDLAATFDYGDADADMSVTTEIRWYKNSAHQPGLDDTAAVDNSLTTLGDVWHFEVRTSDGTDFGSFYTSPTVAINEAPVASNAAIAPAAPTTASQLTVTYSYADGDLDAEGTPEIRWYKNGALQNALHDLAAVAYTHTARGETWYAILRPFDGLSYGAPVSAPAVTIQNSLPSISAVALQPVSVATNDTATCIPSGWADADGDGESYQFSWNRNGSPVTGVTLASLDGAAHFAKGDQLYCWATPFDGLGAGMPVSSPVTTVVNTRPTVANISVAPASPTTAADLTVSYAFGDVDGDADAGSEIRWYKDAQLQSGLNDLQSVAAALTAKGDVWTVSIRPRDGTHFGAAATSASVPILNSPPAFRGGFPSAATENVAYGYALDVTDADGETLTFTVLSGPAGLTVDTFGVIGWTASFGDAGTHTVLFSVYDGSVSDSVGGVITVAYEDDDNDGMPDTWESANGLDPADGADAIADLDADGITNLEEWQNDLDPQSGNAPGAPSVNAPAQASRVAAAEIVLSVNNAADPDGDALRYEFEFFADASLTQRLQHWVDVVSAPTIATVTVTAPTTENAFYYWRARAHDALTAGPWMTAASFQLNRINQAPLAPTLLSPSDQSEVGTLHPTVAVNPGVDPDGDAALNYRFRLCLDNGCNVVVFDASVTTSATSPTTPLTDNTTYYWSAAVSDGTLEGPPMDTVAFRVNTANDAPGTPVFTGLADGDEIATASFVAVVQGSDVDQDPLTYYVEADTAATFDSAAYRSASGAGAGITIGTLLDNTDYLLRVRASDGTLFGQWLTLTVFVNTANDAPGTPVLNNPSNGSTVTSLRPTFSIYPSTDVDGDALSYEFEVYTEAALANRVAFSEPVTSVSPLISWTPAANLSANRSLHWRARSVDGHGLAGAWSAAHILRTNGRNDVPSAPDAVAPIGGAVVHDATPELLVSPAGDADGDTLAYRFEIFADSGLTLLLETSADLASTTFALTETLAPGGVYYWRAAAFDGLARSAWTDTQMFQTAPENVEEATSSDHPDEAATVRKETVQKSGGGCRSAGSPSVLWAALLLIFWFRKRWSQKKILASVLLLGFLATPDILHANGAGAPAGKAGDPVSATLNNPTCSECHGDGGAHGNSLALTVPASYVPGREYTVTVQMLQPQTARNGFEIIPKRHSGGNYVVAGTLNTNGDGKTRIVQGYATHSAVGSSLATWTLKWIAPPTGSGTVTFYGAGNASNDDNSADNGDWITTASATSLENVAPGVAAVNAPAADAIVMAVPVLSINTAVDAHNDPLTYTFELCATASCSTVLQSASGISASGGTAAWQPAIVLTENARYWWRAWANDGVFDGPKFAAVSFWIDAVPQTPGSPFVLEPSDDTYITTLSPLIIVSNAVDPDPTDAGLLTYDFAIAADSGFATLITSVSNVPEGGGQTTWQIGAESPLINLATYYLMVTARDLTNQTKTTTTSFHVDVSNTLPSAPANLLPGGTVVTRSPAFQADASVDADGNPLTYFFSLDVTSTYNSDAQRFGDALTAPAWTPGLPQLVENQRYHWRVRAFDERSFGPFATQTIFVNAVNDAPGAPLPFAPLDGAQVNVRSPALQVQAAEDPDGDALAYVFEVARDPAFLSILERSPPVAPEGETVTWRPALLANETGYYWRAHAVDPSGLAGADGPPFALTVVNANLPPGAPVLDANIAFAVEEAIALAAAPPVDPDGDPVFLFFELYADSKLQVPVTASTGIPPGVAWQPALRWTRGVYYVRVRAEDPSLTGPWSNTAKVTVSGPLPFAERELSTTLRTEVSPGCASQGGGTWGWVCLLIPLVVLRRKLLPFVLVLAGCGSSAETTMIPRPASYREVQSIFNANCISCHSGDTPDGKLNLLAGEAAAELVGAKPANPVALDRGYRLVAPGDPESSFLLYKITEPSLGEGDLMPYRLPRLSADDIEVVRRWIADGASAASE